MIDERDEKFPQTQEDEQQNREGDEIKENDSLPWAGVEDDELGDEKQEGEGKDKKEREKPLPEGDKISTTRLVTTGLRMVLISLLLTSLLYTLAATGVGNLIWRKASRGTLVRRDGQVVGSKLIGQEFDSDKYFHPRPSSKGYNGMGSGSSNLPPTSDKITERAKAILEELKQEGVKSEEVPVSFVTESGSALDPHIVPQSAYVQIPRIAQVTGIDPLRLKEMIEKSIRGKFLGLYGQRRVNVLLLNLEVANRLEST